MAQQKITFISADGKEFKTELEANARDEFLKVEKDVEAYIVAAGLAKAQAGLMRKHIPGYLVFKAQGVVVAAEAGEDTGTGEQTAAVEGSEQTAEVA